ncbi:MAG: hypothetical protein U1F60_09470 [Planctomycetota bacterium]
MSEAPRIVLPYRGQAHGFLWVAAMLFALAALAVPFDATVVALVAASLAVTPLLVGVMLLTIAKGYERQAEALLAGEAALAWTYDRAEWRQHLAEERRRGRWLGPMLVGVAALAGLGVSAGMAEENVRPFGVGALVWLLPPLGGAVLGFGTGVLVAWYRRANLARMANAGGVFCLGATGMYLTGSYWPWAGTGISLRGVGLVDGALAFHFAVSRGGAQTVLVPIAHGYEAAARRFVDGWSR